MEDSGKEKQTDDSHVSSLTDDLFKSMLTPKGKRRSGSVNTELSEITTDRSTPDASPGSLSMRGKKTVRSRSYDMSESLVDDLPDATTSKSPGSLSRRGKRTVRSRSYDMSESLVDDFPDATTSKSQAKKGVQNSRFMENQVVYYTSNDGLKEKAKILKIHLDDHLVPFYDIRIEDSGKEKQTDDSHVSSLTDDLFKSMLTPKGKRRSGSSLTGDVWKSVLSSSSSPTMSSNHLRLDEQRPASPHLGRVKTELKSYGISPDSYVDKEEIFAALKIVRLDSKKRASKLKQELESLGSDSNIFIEKKEMVGALCQAKLERRRERNIEGSYSDGPMRNSVKTQRRYSDGPLLSNQKVKRRSSAAVQAV
jgi:hypothetical protein